MNWFKRVAKNILTRSKKEIPEGVWNKCPSCGEIIPVKEIEANAYVCPKDGYHFRIGPKEYFALLFDGKYELLFEEVLPKDALGFEDKKPYSRRLDEARTKSQSSEAVVVAKGRMDRLSVVIGCMDFTFIGGSMGTVVGERIKRAMHYCAEQKFPLVMISKSGGARMQESAFSLMQMAKTSAALSELRVAGMPYIVVLTDPTTGGVTASYAMLGDIHLAEPGALIGFAGPRVIKEAIGKDLPEGFQRSEFLLEHGFVDAIVDRRQLQTTLVRLLRILLQKPKKSVANGNGKEVIISA